MNFEENPVDNLKSAAQAIMSWMNQTGVAGTMIGGLAVAMHGIPRTTADVDVIASIEELDDALLRSLADFAISPRVSEALEFARSNNVLLLKHEPSGVRLDISIALLPFEFETIENSQTDSNGYGWKIARVADLIVMKAVAGRPKDWADIDGLTKAHPIQDSRRILRNVEQFAEVLDDANLVERVRTLLDAR